MNSVFANTTQQFPTPVIPSEYLLNTRNKSDGRIMLDSLSNNTFPVVFFDPQYRGVLEKLSYGNEGEGRTKARVQLPQMPDPIIQEYIEAIELILVPSGHLFLWVDKFHLCEGIGPWLTETNLEIVDMIVWDKMLMGMGYRSRRQSEYCMVIQKKPKRAKGIWKIHNIKDVYQEKAVRGGPHPHMKPIGLQSVLIEAVTNAGDYVVDPAAGSFSVLDACLQTGRNFVGCDLNG